MIWRFALYGFLKNLRFFEIFIILAFRERHMSFFMIGILFAIRQVTLNILEIPSGAIADSFGRKRCMVLSMLAYFIAFFILAWGTHVLLAAIGMCLFGIGDAFRSGTHKAMIYTWLRREGRIEERTRVYGFTRSWSKTGSAISAVLAAVIVVIGQNYTAVFWASLVPVLLNLINLATYPACLNFEEESAVSRKLSAGAIFRTSWETLKETFQDLRKNHGLRRLIGQSIAIEGTYETVKDFLQPVVKLWVVAIPLLTHYSKETRVAVLNAAAYCLVYLASAQASLHAHRWERFCGDSERSAVSLLTLFALLYLGLGGGLWGNVAVAAVGIFILMGLCQNLWRPIHVGRFDKAGDANRGATILSVESQAKHGAAAILTPVLGYLIDRQQQIYGTEALRAFWPLVLCAIFPILAVWRQCRQSAIAPEDTAESA